MSMPMEMQINAGGPEVGGTFIASFKHFEVVLW